MIENTGAVQANSSTAFPLWPGYPIRSSERRNLADIALFEGNKKIGNVVPSEREVWEAALITGLVTDVPVADEEGGQILPSGYHVERVDEAYDPRPDWNLPKEIS